MAAPDPTEVVRKLRQHDNEFESVYGLLRVIDGKVDTLDGKVDTLEAKVDAGFERLDARSERLESGQQQILDLLRGRQQGDTTTE